MTNIVGAAAGSKIDRSRGNSGIKGAVVGALVEGLVRTILPIVATAVIGWAVKKFVTDKSAPSEGRDAKTTLKPE